jgi:hypothetical protein
LRFKGKIPTPLYYYRELQNLRDPLHFRAPVNRIVHKKALAATQSLRFGTPMPMYLDAKSVEKQFQLDTRKEAIRRWEGKRGRHGKKRA